MDLTAAREQLEDERRDLAALAEAQRSVLDAPGELDDERSSIHQHIGDAASEMFDREEALSLVLDAEQRIQDIDHALHKIATGTFGRCEACNRSIGDERLTARPDARFCVTDERAWEEAR